MRSEPLYSLHVMIATQYFIPLRQEVVELILVIHSDGWSLSEGLLCLRIHPQQESWALLFAQAN